VRLLAAAAAALLAAGCGGGGGATSAGGLSAPPSSTLPSSGTVTYTDGRVYTIAPAGSTLTLPGLAVRATAVRWAAAVAGAIRPPGTRVFAVVTVAVTNRTQAAQLVGGTQVWFLDASRRAYLAAAGARVPSPLVGATVPPGGTVTGTLAFAVPGRSAGRLLVYTFADAAAIADAHHVGLLGLG
jgi:Domain of unknown function (DUF4352)